MYWIVRGRNYIRATLQKCAIFKKFNARCYHYPSSTTLQKSRDNKCNPFWSIGVDYVGPLYYKAYKQPLFSVTTYDKKEIFKCNVVLQTCIITRDIILDLIKDSYTKTFTNSLHTFIAASYYENKDIKRKLLTSSGMFGDVFGQRIDKSKGVVPKLNDIVIIQDEKFPQQLWSDCKTI